jgi:DNA-binding response OmpR family regulator
VVVVEDDADVREVIVDCLRREGYEVLPAANGLEGLLQIKHHRPAIVTLDLHMPRLGGLDALRRIRTFDPAVRVVVVTGDLERETHERALAMGASVILTKPMGLAELVAAVRAAAPLVGPVLTGATSPVAPVTLPTVSPAPRPMPSGAPRVLVVDDDPEIRELLEEFLRSRGYEVHSASHSGDAIRAAVETAPAVILLDIDLPGAAGHEIIAPIRLAVPGAAVIMVSGTSNVDAAKRALALGAFDYVTKPIDLGYLAEAIEMALAVGALGP